MPILRCARRLRERLPGRGLNSNASSFVTPMGEAVLLVRLGATGAALAPENRCYASGVVHEHICKLPPTGVLLVAHVDPGTQALVASLAY